MLLLLGRLCSEKKNKSMREKKRHRGLLDILLEVFLISVTLIASGLAETHQKQERIDVRQARIEVPFYPINSVYELRHAAAPNSGNGASLPSLVLLDKNNVGDPSKEEVLGGDNMNEEEYTNGDYVEDDYLTSEQDSGVSQVMKTEDGSKDENRNGSENNNHNNEKQTSNHTNHLYSIYKNIPDQEANHHVDSSSTQYDSYYYYDDYENDTHSAGDNVDYLDPVTITDKKKIELTNDDKSKLSEVNKSQSSEFKQTLNNKNSSEISGENPRGLTRADSKFTEIPELSKLEDEVEYYEDDSEPSEESFSSEASIPIESSSVLIGEAIVSVVTTKSVVNGTFSVPVTPSPITLKQSSFAPKTSSSSTPSSSGSIEEPSQSSTEDSRILASVQTSRSISGARFLPFPVIDRFEQFADNKEESTSKSSSSTEFTESVIDEINRAQTESSNTFRVSTENIPQIDKLPETIQPSQNTYSSSTVKPSSKFVSQHRYSSERKTSTTPATSTTTLKSTTLKGSTKRFRYQTTLDDLEGLLPKNYPKSSLRRQYAKSTTPVVTESTTLRTENLLNFSTLKSARIIPDISSFLPPDYKLETESATKAIEKSLFSEILAKTNIKIDSFLPSGYKRNSSSFSSSLTTEENLSVQDPSIISRANISASLFSDYKYKKNTTEIDDSQQSSNEKLSILRKSLSRDNEKKIKNSSSDINEGRSNDNVNGTIQDLFKKSQVDIAAFLPKDFNLRADETYKREKGRNETPAVKSSFEVTTSKPEGIKLVFPSRPGGRKPSVKITTPQSRGEGPAAVTPKIQKGWPTRATTEFTGWPTSSTTPISIEKLLEAARTATFSSINASVIPIIDDGLIISTTKTVTTTTTTTTVRPTTPGICKTECEVAGTIRIIGNATWVPELLDRNTREWQELANMIEKEMNIVFSKSTVFRKWFKNIRIDAFSQGSVLVDFFIQLNDLHESINTQQLKVIFHDSLRNHDNNRWNETKTKGPLKLGPFTIDSKFTDFIVIPKVVAPQLTGYENRLIPQWAIAVIVIGIGGLLFIIVFGVSVLANRHSSAKLKPSMMVMYDEGIIKNVVHATHAQPAQKSSDYSRADMHTIWNEGSTAGWHDKSLESNSNKILMGSGPIHGNKKYNNMYDSWQSGLNGFYYNDSRAISKYGGYNNTINLSRQYYPNYDTTF